MIKTFVINLDKDRKKLKKIAARLKSLKVPFERWSAVRGKKQNNVKALSVGCWSSHLQIYNHIVKNKIEKALILEDDCHFTPEFKPTLNNVIKLSGSAHFNYDIFFLGYCYVQDDPHSPLGFVRMKKERPRCTHSYIVSYKGAFKFLSLFRTIDRPFDKTLGNLIYTGAINSYRTNRKCTYQPWQKA